MSQSKERPVTKKMVNCPVYGAPRDLADTLLPTNGDILKYYLFVKHEIDLTRPRDDVAIISEKVASKTEELWHRASIHTVSHARTYQMVRASHDKYRNLLKPYKGRQKDPSYIRKLEAFKEEESKTF